MNFQQTCLTCFVRTAALRTWKFTCLTCFVTFALLWKCCRQHRLLHRNVWSCTTRLRRGNWSRGEPILTTGLGIICKHEMVPIFSLLFLLSGTTKHRCYSWPRSTYRPENAQETMEPAGFALTLTAGNGQLKTMIISFLQQGETQKRFTDAKTQCGRPSRACDKTFYHPRTIQILSEATAADTVWWTTWKVLGSLTTLQWVLQGFATKERLLATGSLPMNKPELHWKRTTIKE